MDVALQPCAVLHFDIDTRPVARATKLHAQLQVARAVAAYAV